MKKILALVLAAVMLFGTLAACADKKDNENNGDNNTTVTGTPDSGNNSGTPDSGNDSDVSENDNLSAKLANLFVETVKANSGKNSEEIAELLVQDELLSGKELMTYNYGDAEFMAGFDSNFAPEAFVKATYASPVFSEPFLFYVFELNEDTDASAFADYLKEHADAAWNGNVTVDQIASASEGNMAFIVMCTEQELEVVDYNQKLIDRFNDYMATGSDFSAESIAYYICGVEGFPLDLDAVPAEKGWLAGLDEFDQFEEAAQFAPMIGSIPFVGYVFVIDNSVDADDFIADLESRANLRWNVCTEADLILTQSFTDDTKNVVMFVMCPANENY